MSQNAIPLKVDGFDVPPEGEPGHDAALIAAMAAMLAEGEQRRFPSSEVQLQRRREFFQRMDAEAGNGRTLYPHEQLAFWAVTRLTDKNVLGRATLFDNGGLGFMEYVKVIADAILEGLPKINDHVELEYLIAGRPEPEAPAE